MRFVNLCYIIIGANISERKSGTERTKKRELVFFTPPGGATRTLVHRLDATWILPVTITWDIIIPGPYAARTESQLNKQAKHTQFNNFTQRISFAKSSEFHFMLSRVLYSEQSA